MKPASKLTLLVLLGLLLVATLVLGCGGASGITAEKTEPEAGATLTEAPSALRIWLSQEPDVQNSAVELTGPTGELVVRGLHTMGSNDLMVQIGGDVEDGEYTASWKTADSDGQEHSGSWSFTVKSGG